MRATTVVLTYLACSGYGSRIRSASKTSDADLQPETRRLEPSQALALLFLAQHDQAAAFQVAGLSAPSGRVGARGNPSLIMKEQLKYKVTVNVLKDKCRTFGLKVSGTKAELIARLEEHPDGLASLKDHLEVEESVINASGGTVTKVAPVKKVKLSVDESVINASEPPLKDADEDQPSPGVARLVPVPKHLPVIWIDAENIRGATGFKLSYDALLAGTALWTSKHDAKGRVVLVVDHSSHRQGFYLPRHGVAVAFAGTKQTADDVMVASVNYLATEQKRNSLLITADQLIQLRCLDMRATPEYPLSFVRDILKIAEASSLLDPSEKDSGDLQPLSIAEIKALRSEIPILSETSLRGRRDWENPGGSKEDIEGLREFLSQSENDAEPDHDMFPAEAYIKWMNSEVGQATLDEQEGTEENPFKLDENAPAAGTDEDTDKPTLYLENVNKRIKEQELGQRKAAAGRVTERLLSVALGKKSNLGVALFDGSGTLLRYASYTCPAETQQAVLEEWLAGKLETDDDAIPAQMDDLRGHTHASKVPRFDREGLPEFLPVTQLILEDFSGRAPNEGRMDELKALNQARKTIDPSSDMFIVAPTRWRHDLLNDKERKNGDSQRSTFHCIAQQIITDAGPPGVERSSHNTQVNEDASISLGYWATRQLGWVTRNPAVRRYTNGNVQKS